MPSPAATGTCPAGQPEWRRRPWPRRLVRQEALERQRRIDACAGEPRRRPELAHEQPGARFVDPPRPRSGHRAPVRAVEDRRPRIGSGRCEPRSISRLCGAHDRSKGPIGACADAGARRRRSARSGRAARLASRACAAALPPSSARSSSFCAAARLALTSAEELQGSAEAAGARQGESGGDDGAASASRRSVTARSESESSAASWDTWPAMAVARL